MQRWKERLQELGVGEKEFAAHQKALTKQFGFAPALNDVIWRALNTLVSRKKTHFDLKLVYLEMAALVREEGKDPKPYLASAAKHELAELQGNPFISKVRITTANDRFVCAKCREMESQVFALADAVETLPVPNQCQNPSGCRCGYIVNIEDQFVD